MARKKTKSEIGFRADNGLLARGTAHPARRSRRLLGGVLPLLFLQAEPAATTVRPDFDDRMVASPGARSMGLAFTPDGRMLIP
jgi:hypothetical protein